MLAAQACQGLELRCLYGDTLWLGHATPHTTFQGAHLSQGVQPSCFAVRKLRHGQEKRLPRIP